MEINKMGITSKTHQARASLNRKRKVSEIQKSKKSALSITYHSVVYQKSMGLLSTSTRNEFGVKSLRKIKTLQKYV